MNANTTGNRTDAPSTGEVNPLRQRIRLARLHLASRQAPAALAVIVACAVSMRIALQWRWNSYGALQLPLIFEAVCAAAIAVTTASPFGEPERAAGRLLPYLRLGTALALTAATAGALAAAALSTYLAAGILEMMRNLAGLIGIGLLCGTVMGGALAWTGPITYLIVGVYGLYTQWHGPAITTPWIWPSRPGHDIAAAVCAGVVFTAGLMLITVRGARDPDGE